MLVVTLSWSTIATVIANSHAGRKLVLVTIHVSSSLESLDSDYLRDL